MMNDISRPGEPEWSIKARREQGDFALDLIHCLPTDWKVQTAKRNHLDFWSPIGLHLWNEERDCYEIKEWLDE